MTYTFMEFMEVMIFIKSYRRGCTCILGGPQAQPIDFSRVDLVDYNAVGIEGFDEAELDQYLPPNGLQTPLTRAPPSSPSLNTHYQPPYVANPASTSSAPTWMAGVNSYRIATSASGHLQRMATTTNQAVQPQPMSPGAASVEAVSVKVQNNMAVSVNGGTSFDNTNIDGKYQNQAHQQQAQSVKLEHSPNHFSHGEPVQHHQKFNPYDIDSRFQTMSDHSLDYSSSTPYFGSHGSSEQTPASPYQCLRPLYAAQPITGGDWERYPQS